MNIGGLQESSLLDYPGKIATIIWTTGCNFRCPFCYNPELVLDAKHHIPEETIFSFLEGRKGKIDAVSISGGEPFLQKDLISFLEKIKQQGFLVKIDTNGSFPVKLEQVLDDGLVDYVSMDVKASRKHYAKITGVTVDIDDIDRSIHMIMKKAPAYEFKTTVIPIFHKDNDIVDIARWLKGAKLYFLQQLKTDVPMLSQDKDIKKTYTKKDLIRMCELVKPYVETCHIRGV